ncbi:hypothetical protein [Salininema proteolyticum]|uniref:Uncharacterized protein n=1 Tax=Salininema proteolyticum TaxID=1607685 RepID=A0ABV8TXU8_9ACTN
MGDATIRLSRLGFEKGTMLPAVAMAVLLALPIGFWTGAEALLGDSSATVSEGEEVTLVSIPGKTATLTVRVPSGTWKSSPALNGGAVTLRQGATTISITVDGQVQSLGNLLERRAEAVTRGHSDLVATSFRQYEPEGAKRPGEQATLVGRDQGGAIVVTGNGKGAAATVVALAPASQPAERTLALVDSFTGLFGLEGK